MSYFGNFAEYYDKIFAKKDYDQETQFILDVCELFSKEKINNVLDFGCGTGTHSYLLSKKIDCKIVGYDKSSSMISLANKKYKDVKNCFFVDDINKLKGKFGLVISMFYVVNHINELKELEKYFNDISLRCCEGDIFIFDCWNAVAAMRDPPVFSYRERYAEEDTKIITSCTPKSDLMNSSVHMINSVEIYKNDSLFDKFEYVLNHTLWSPRILRELLEAKGFEVLKAFKPYDANSPITPDDYKIVYVCERRGGV